MMPKSTATISWPSRIDEQIARMHVGVEEAVAQRVAQEASGSPRAPSCRQVEPVASSAARSCSGVPSIHSSVSTSARCGPSRPPARGSPDRPWCSPPSRTARRLRAADPSRSRPSGASVSTISIRRSRRASGEQRFGVARGEGEARRDRRGSAARRRAAAPSPRPACGPSGVVDFGAMHLRDRGGGDRRAERREDLAQRLAERAPRPPLPPRPAGTAPCGPAALSRSRASATPTTSGRVARNCPSLT